MSGMEWETDISNRIQLLYRIHLEVNHRHQSRQAICQATRNLHSNQLCLFTVCR